jgi:hypothetical protein
MGHVALERLSVGSGASAGVAAATEPSADRWPHEVHVMKCDEPRGIKGMKKIVKNLLEVIWVCAHVTPQCEQVLVT